MVSRSVAWTSNRRATSTCASVLRAACSIARPTKGSAPRTGTPPARRASRRLVCGRHRAGCVEEAMTLFASDEVEQCPVCGKDACAQHRAACGYCGRHVCTADLEQPSRRCATCAQLATVADPPEHVVTA